RELHALTPVEIRGALSEIRAVQEPVEAAYKQGVLETLQRTVAEVPGLRDDGSQATVRELSEGLPPADRRQFEAIVERFASEADTGLLAVTDRARLFFREALDLTPEQITTRLTELRDTPAPAPEVSAPVPVPEVPGAGGDTGGRPRTDSGFDSTSAGGDKTPGTEPLVLTEEPGPLTATDRTTQTTETTVAAETAETVEVTGVTESAEPVVVSGEEVPGAVRKTSADDGPVIPDITEFLAREARALEEGRTADAVALQREYITARVERTRWEFEHGGQRDRQAGAEGVRDQDTVVREALRRTLASMPELAVRSDQPVGAVMRSMTSEQTFMFGDLLHASGLRDAGLDIVTVMNDGSLDRVVSDFDGTFRDFITPPQVEAGLFERGVLPLGDPLLAGDRSVAEAAFRRGLLEAMDAGTPQAMEAFRGKADAVLGDVAKREVIARELQEMSPFEVREALLELRMVQEPVETALKQAVLETVEQAFAQVEGLREGSVQRPVKDLLAELSTVDRQEFEAAMRRLAQAADKGVLSLTDRNRLFLDEMMGLTPEEVASRLTEPPVRGDGDMVAGDDASSVFDSTDFTDLLDVPLTDPLTAGGGSGEVRLFERGVLPLGDPLLAGDGSVAEAAFRRGLLEAMDAGTPLAMEVFRGKADGVLPDVAKREVIARELQEMSPVEVREALLELRRVQEPLELAFKQAVREASFST
ncbi:hypothetical protein ACFWSQ_41100, partial [Streptomyces sp. NPDC058583]